MLKIERKWAMPSKDTFTIKPIKELLDNYVIEPRFWIDPFAGSNSPALFTNDINPKACTQFHLDALQFLENFDKSNWEGIIFDPPYSVRQVAECYKSFGYEVTQETTQASWYTKLKKEIARIAPEYVISFGWNSGGVGKKLGYEIVEILLVPHGGVHNDTICTVERIKKEKKD